MKKKLLFIAAVLFVMLICVYVFIPSTIDISNVTMAKATRDGTFRTIATKQEWEKWWNYGLHNKGKASNNTLFSYNGYVYNLTESGYSSAIISIHHTNKTINSKLSILQLATDSIAIIWQCTPQTTANPFEKIQQYFEAVSLKKNITTVLGCLKAFIENDKNIYGIKVIKSKVKDSLLISKKQIFTRQPDMKDVYSLINNLKQYASKKNCLQTDAPMLNILQDSNKYRVMVALPINKEIETQQPISFVKMTNGNFMVTQVQGGLATIQNALHQMQLYFDDYDKIPMAITFQYLITDRLKETDTTKWVTEIYAPVFK